MDLTELRQLAKEEAESMAESGFQPTQCVAIQMPVGFVATVPGYDNFGCPIYYDWFVAAMVAHAIRAMGHELAVKNPNASKMV
tara:strand:+ start:22372 stop:22620 length:249 start_codon:yes stop_codon:yes gene_type:complete